MRTSELTDALLDYWTARAEGVQAAELELRANGTLCVRNTPVVGLALGAVHVLDYSTNWAWTGPLVEKHLDSLTLEPSGWRARTDLAPVGALRVYPCASEEGDTPLIAICRAVVRAAFGDEVEDLPC